MNVRFTPMAAALGLAAGMMLSSVAHADTIRIAIAGPFTGALTQYGDMVKEGVDTAIETINAGGGVLGNKLEAVVIDDGCEPKQGPVVANRVVNEKIHYVVGHVCSGATIAATPVYNNEGVVMISPSATSPLVTDGKNYDMIFRTIGRDDQQGPFAAEYIAKQLKPKKVAILHDKQTYGSGVATQVQKSLEKDGVNIAMFEGINVGDSDYSAVISKLKALGPDLIYFGGYHPELGLLLRQAREQGLETQFMGPEGVANKDLAAIAGPAVDKLLVTLPADFTKRKGNEQILEHFKKYQRSPDGAFTMTAYAAVQVLADSINAVGTDPSKVADYMHEHSFDTAIGKVDYDAKGDLKHFEFAVFRWDANGNLTQIQP